ncbi:MAG TPA: hypothetical protein VG733_00940 [Chthoniobacteraceae bacterium]|nr:hypothetical protein [Chthoniobacteraceae bacterium]
METTTLYRPIGQPELDLIAASGFREFPPRLFWQPIFYPVLNENYAIHIAREWNTKDAENGSVGYVTRFAVKNDYLSKFPPQRVGNAEAIELWVPAEELAEFNKHIVGLIEVIHEFRNEESGRG